MKINIVKVGSFCAALTAMGVLGFSIDGRYQTAEAATSQATRMEIKRETGDLDNQVRLINHELTYLKGKQNRDSDDDAREVFLRIQLSVLLTRLVELQQ